MQYRTYDLLFGIVRPVHLLALRAHDVRGAHARLTQRRAVLRPRDPVVAFLEHPLFERVVRHLLVHVPHFLPVSYRVVCVAPHDVRPYEYRAQMLPLVVLTDIPHDVHVRVVRERFFVPFAVLFDARADVGRLRVQNLIHHRPVLPELKSFTFGIRFGLFCCFGLFGSGLCGSRIYGFSLRFFFALLFR